jgi:hypothetical protein
VPSAEDYRPDVAHLTRCLHDPALRHEHADIVHSLLWCQPEEVQVVVHALVSRSSTEADRNLLDTIGEALGAIWAEHGVPSLETLDRLTGTTRSVAIATLTALRAQRLAKQLRSALSSFRASVTLDGKWINVSSALAKPGRSIRVYVRDVSDFDVQFHVPERKGSPFEQVIAGTLEEAEQVEAAMVQFATNMVEEKLVLAWDSRLVRGGRQFLTPSHANESRKHISWVASWRGTYDRGGPIV